MPEVERIWMGMRLEKGPSAPLEEIRAPSFATDATSRPIPPNSGRDVRGSVSGKRESEQKKESEKLYVYERSYGSFSRSFTLPDDIDSDKTTAQLKDGVLTVMVPKRPGAQAKRVPLQK